ncbi:MAG TPA: VOC family protein [Candidatus Binataceae bacterium]|nr:VOC family protein [Candidatus Binataceae bacterium]
MLNNFDLIAFVGTANLERAAAFYRDILGLRLVRDDPFGLVFDAHGTMLRISKVKELTPAPYTVLGWKVADIRAAIDDLSKRGVSFALYDGMPQDERGIWTSADGHQVAWFKDPDGNTLSLTQFGA